jgi:hypothetical protein
MEGKVFSFRGWFCTHRPFGDTFRYLDLSEDVSLEDAIIQGIWIFYYPKLLKKMSASMEVIAQVQEECILYCNSAITELDGLEQTFRTHAQEKRKPIFKRRSPRSQDFLDIEIDGDGLDPDFIQALSLFQLGEVGDVRYNLCQAISAIYHPLASNAFADPFERVIDAIGKSRRKFQWLLVQYKGGENFKIPSPLPISTGRASSSLEIEVSVPKKSKTKNW